MDKLLTIVIPAYNMEALLPRCLDSICTEKVMDKVQVIVVNDGSKDRTLEIARSYENQYPQYITVIDKPNGNYGSCMNVGLALAKGKYFRTLDADDWYNTKAYELFVEELNNTEADMLLCERYNYIENDNKYELINFDQNLPLHKDISVKNELWTQLKKHETVTCLCYKTDLLKKCKMKWSEKVFYTDTEYDYFPLSEIKTIRLIPLPVYIYLKGRNDQSMSIKNISRNFHSFHIVANRIVCDFIENASNTSEVYLLQKKYLLQILIFFYGSLLFHGFKYKKEIDEIDIMLKKMPDIYKEISNILTYRKHKYVSIYRNNKMKFWIIHKVFKIHLKLHPIIERIKNITKTNTQKK